MKGKEPGSLTAWSSRAPTVYTVRNRYTSNLFKLLILQVLGRFLPYPLLTNTDTYNVTIFCIKMSPYAILLYFFLHWSWRRKVEIGWYFQEKAEKRTRNDISTIRARLAPYVNCTEVEVT